MHVRTLPMRVLATIARAGRYRFLPVLLVVIGCSDRTSPTEAASDQEPRASVRAGPVITPLGELPAACVHHRPASRRVRADSAITFRDGLPVDLPACAELARPAAAPGFSTAAGPALVPNDPRLTGERRVRWSDAQWSGNFGKITGRWTVPPAPLQTYTGQTVYYAYISMSNEAGGDFAMPVLQYGYNGRFGGNYWTIAAWECFEGYGCIYDDPESALPGDVVVGTVADDFPYLHVKIENERTGLYSAVSEFVNQDYHTVARGVVEAHGFTVCNHYPRNGVFFRDVAVYDDHYTLANQVYPSWVSRSRSVTPSCNFGIEHLYSSSVDIFHNPAPAPTLGSVSTSPSPAMQYGVYVINLYGNGFNTATAEALIYGPGGTCCAYIRNSDFHFKHYNQLTDSLNQNSIPGTYTVRVRNEYGGQLSAPRTFVVQSLY